MRVAAFLVVSGLVTVSAGCGKKVAAPVLVAEPKNAERDAAALEVWEVVQVEVPLPDGKVSEELAGFKFAVLAQVDNVPAPEPGGIVPPQPVPFSHQHHAGQLGIDCRYCHTSVEKPGDRIRPQLKTCMNCHQQISDRGMLADQKGRLADPWLFVAARDAAKTPHEIDLTECDLGGRPLPGRPVRRGIYKEDGDGLVIALTFGNTPRGFRPAEFKPETLAEKSDQYRGVAVFHLKRS